MLSSWYPLFVRFRAPFLVDYFLFRGSELQSPGRVVKSTAVTPCIKFQDVQTEIRRLQRQRGVFLRFGFFFSSVNFVQTWLTSIVMKYVTSQINNSFLPKHLRQTVLAESINRSATWVHWGVWLYVLTNLYDWSCIKLYVFFVCFFLSDTCRNILNRVNPCLAMLKPQLEVTGLTGKTKSAADAVSELSAKHLLLV